MPRPAKAPRLDKRADSPHYFVRWHDGKEPRRTSTDTGDREEAESFLENFTKELNNPVIVAVDPEAPRSLSEVMIAEALGLYIENKIAGKPSQTQTATWVMRLLEFWGEVKVDAISEATITGKKGYIAHRRAKRGLKGQEAISYATIERELTVLRAAITWCWRNGKFLTQPLPIAKAPATAERDLWMEPQDVALLLDAAQPHVVLWCLIAISSGGRKSAILQVKWRGQVDFKARTLDLLKPGAVQNDKLRSKVPMTGILYDALLAASKIARTPYVIEYGFPKGKDAHGIEQFEYKPIVNIKTGFMRAARRAAWEAIRQARIATAAGDVPLRHQMIESAWRLKKVTPHTFRHTAATWMAQAGDSLAKIGGFIGHKDPRTTAKYAHHHPDHLRDLASSLDERFSRGVKSPK